MSRRDGPPSRFAGATLDQLEERLAQINANREQIARDKASAENAFKTELTRVKNELTASKLQAIQARTTCQSTIADLNTQINTLRQSSDERVQSLTARVAELQNQLQGYENRLDEIFDSMNEGMNLTDVNQESLGEELQMSINEFTALLEQARDQLGTGDEESERQINEIIQNLEREIDQKRLMLDEINNQTSPSPNNDPAPDQGLNEIDTEPN